MTKIQEFNERYGLTNVSTNAFAKVDHTDQSNDLAGRPRKNITDIAKRFVKNPVAMGALFVFVVIILIAAIAPAVSKYSANGEIMKSEGQLKSYFSNLPPVGKLKIEFVDKTGYDYIKSTGIDVTLVKFDTIDPSITGKYAVQYDPWKLASVLDKFNHHSIIGTDSQARDIWTRTWYGTGTSLKLALLVAAISVVIGTIVGSWIGLYVGSWIDIIFMQVCGAFLSIPTIIWNIFILMILPPGYWAEVVMFSLTGWIGAFALARQYMWKYVNADFMKAAKTLGVSQFGRILKHALPNYIGVIAYSFVISVPGIIEAEATLGFVGFSPNPTGASLGNVLNEMGQAISGVSKNPAYILLPTIIIAGITFSLKYIAIGINDAVEPKYAKR